MLPPDRCCAADGSPAWPRGGPAGQRDRVAPGGRSGPGRAGAPRPVIGRWCPAPRGLARWPGDGRGQSGSVWWCVRCGAEVHFVRCGEGTQYISGTKSSGVRWGDGSDVSWSERTEGDVATERVKHLPARSGDMNPSKHPDNNNSQPHFGFVREAATVFSPSSYRSWNSSPASRWRVLGFEAYLIQGTTSRLRLPSPSRYRSIGRSVGY